MSARALTSAHALADAGLIAREDAAALAAVAARYAVAVTPAMAQLIDPSDPADPIARQFLPDRRELEPAPQERADPIGDAAHRPVPGVVHRYPDRALLTLTHACPVYCRFCFRREVVGPGGLKRLDGEALQTAINYIAAKDAIWEVVLTGGDPLALSAARLADVMKRLGGIPHLRVIRAHSRVPTVAPERIDAGLVAALKASGKTVFVALHANHPRELTPAARAACARLIDAGLPMVSQSVLLAGVNDDVETLAALMRAFVETRIKPYYLHHGDLARGTAHFRTSIEKGQALMRALRARVSGLCLPAYMLDIPGGYGKIPIGPTWLEREGPERYRARDPFGGVHLYPPDAETEPAG